MDPMLVKLSKLKIIKTTCKVNVDAHLPVAFEYEGSSCVLAV